MLQNENENDIQNLYNVINYNQRMINYLNNINQMNYQFIQGMLENNNNNNEITVKFESLNKIVLSLQVKYDEKLSSVIKKYKQLVCDLSKNKEYYFEDKKINMELTVAEQGLKNNCIIKVVESNKEMEDDDEKMLIKKKRDSSFNLKNGINILGKCSNKNCEFKGKEVTSYYNDDKFELVSNLYNIMCPYCSCIIIPKKIIFYNCNFIISGKKLDGEFVVPFALERIDINDNNHYYVFNPNSNNNNTYIELICQILIRY
jgi:hypothetical protein